MHHRDRTGGRAALDARRAEAGALALPLTPPPHDRRLRVRRALGADDVLRIGPRPQGPLAALAGAAFAFRRPE